MRTYPTFIDVPAPADIFNRTPPPGAKVFRVTERASFRQCRRQWHYQYGRNLVPKTTVTDARTYGTLIHKCLAAYYGEGFNTEALIRVWNDEVGKVPLTPEMVALGPVMLSSYIEFSQKADADYSVVRVHGKPYVEQTMYSQIYEGVYLRGTCDLLLYQHSTGTYWIVDHKTYERFLDPKFLPFDDQLTAYIWLLKRNGIKVRGGFYNQLLKKIPEEPKLLQSGKISRDRSISTTHAVYMDTVRKHGQDPDDYRDFLATYPEPAFFAREPVHRSDRQLRSIQTNIAQELAEMGDPDIFLYPSPTRNCLYCDYQRPCQIQNDEGDVEYILSADFMFAPDEDNPTLPISLPVYNTKAS